MTDRPILDRLYELDWRSLNYPIGSVLPVKRPRSYTWRVDRWLDQGREGACVGFAFAHELAARPQEVENVGFEDARDIYLRAQRIDEWPGEAYSGTSVLAGAKICQEDGYFSGYRWALSLEELVMGVAYSGPAVLGLNWYSGMWDADSDGFLHPTGTLAGGHAILAHAVKIVYRSKVPWRSRTWRDVDLQRSYVVLHNSWGPTWGRNGRARLSLVDLERLLHERGDACFPQRTRKVTAPR